MNVRWSHCVLRVRDLDAMISFYCDALGFVVADRGRANPADDIEIAFLSGSSSDHHQIGLLSGREDSDVPRGGRHLDHNAFRVDTIQEVKDMVAWIEADDRIGKPFPVSHGNAVSVYFSDPEGNGVEVFCDTPWHVQQPQITGWDTTASPEDILAAIEAEFADAPEFMPIEEYRALQAERFGEAGTPTG
ncbi:MAG: VOC family protein [Actinomycetota bacterium]